MFQRPPLGASENHKAISPRPCEKPAFRGLLVRRWGWRWLAAVCWLAEPDVRGLGRAARRRRRDEVRECKLGDACDKRLHARRDRPVLFGREPVIGPLIRSSLAFTHRSDEEDEGSNCK